MIEPETVVVKLVVASQSRKRSHPNAVGEEDLSRTINPGLAVQQLGPVHVHVIPEAVERSWKLSLVSSRRKLCWKNTWQGEGAAKQDEHDEVGEEGGEPDDLAGGVETLGDDEVDDDPGDHQAAGELPLHSSKAVLQTRVLLQHTVPAIKSLEGSMIYHIRSRLC